MPCISIEQNNRIYQLLLSYVAANLVDDSEDAEPYSIKVLPSRKRGNNLDSEADGKDKIRVGRIELRIGLGTYTFRGLHGERFKAVHRCIGEPVGTESEAVRLTILELFTVDCSPIEEMATFLNELLAATENTDESTFTCYNWHVCHQYWREEARVQARSLDSVVLPQATKDRLLRDADNFLSPTTRDWYVRNGIPYRRSYLFHGVPGTGKTSLVQALAGHFNRNVCYLMPTHPRMTDDSLREAIQELPDDSIVVFEDIDSLFAKDRSNKINTSSLTFSGLLNALDGIKDPNGQIFVLTTNLREDLDAALIRNGRVDLHVEFTYALPEQMIQMWKNFYPNATDLADEFAARVMAALDESNMKTTTSSLLHFFVQQMAAAPAEALERVHTIVEEQKLNDVAAATAAAAKKTKQSSKKVQRQKKNKQQADNNSAKDAKAETIEEATPEEKAPTDDSSGTRTTADALDGSVHKDVKKKKSRRRRSGSGKKAATKVPEEIIASEESKEAVQTQT